MSARWSDWDRISSDLPGPTCHFDAWCLLMDCSEASEMFDRMDMEDRCFLYAAMCNLRESVRADV